jgi:preprotein translocase subunit YajC
MLITPAYAQAAQAAQGSPSPQDFLSLQSPIWMVIALILIMYFLMIRPQQRKVKQHQEMVKALRRGDTVVTNGGLVGKVTKVVDDDQVELELGTVDLGKGESKTVRVRQLRSMITDVRAKGEPVKEESAS